MEPYQITKECFNWCMEQYQVHERNLEIKDQNFIIIALVCLVLYNIISLNWDRIIANNEMNIDEFKLEKIHEGLHFAVFVMLIAHLVYVIIG